MWKEGGGDAVTGEEMFLITVIYEGKSSICVSQSINIVQTIGLYTP